MNWKASVIAAVIVIAAGAAVGVAIGGKTKKETQTVTVARTVVAPGQAPATTPAGGGTTPTTPGTTTPGGGSSAPVQYLDADTNPSANDNISIATDELHPRDQIGGETVTDAVIATLFGNDNAAPAIVTYSASSGQQFLKTRMGFEHGTAPNTDVEVEFRAETEHGRRLIKPLRFDTLQAKSVTVPLGGTHNVAIVFTDNNCKSSNSCAFGDVTMVLGMARFTG